ncbi:MAG: glycosylhydrolase-like jelly roll fold domain-containing protein, partial [Spartobacteria bacterium]
YYSGTGTYRKSFDIDESKIQNSKSNIFLGLGTVNHLARVRLNGRDLGVVWTAPWGVEIPAGLLKPTGNELAIEVTNVWANRLIGDEQEPPDCEWLPGHMGNGGYLKRFPDWFVKNEPRPSKGRFCFTTWNYFTKNSPLIPSGLLGPVTISTNK